MSSHAPEAASTLPLVRALPRAGWLPPPGLEMMNCIVYDLQADNCKVYGVKLMYCKVYDLGNVNSKVYELLVRTIESTI